ncbi:hypothetical protein PCANC_07883 [Puccinia coronata f. sp. avenae]|uniref:Uncharacterized protein n=1 Tax=Puccinia coronata f. sp. avenae TaxID=200324 RepID=A0A2N5VCY9_9BASI|nr:hypothetical protein PCANC_07883 [Puccinia coronata f. sp. avenae]
MLFIVLAILLLSVRPLECYMDVVGGVESVSTVRNAAINFADLSKVKAQKISDIHLIKPNERMDMRTSFLESEKRFIFLDNDGTVKPFRKPNERKLQRTIDRALKRHAGDSRNEIWIITAKDVSELEKTYGHIPGLNFAGNEGTEIAQRSQPLVNLPDAGPIGELREAVSRVASENGITFSKTIDQKYFSNYHIPIDTEKLMKQAQEAQEAETTAKLLNEAKEAGAETPISKEAKEAAMKQKLSEAKTRLMVQTKAKFEALLGNEKFKDYEVLVGHGIDNDPSYFRIVIKHKTHQHKGTLVQALLAQHTGNETPFVLTMGDMKMDEPMHQLAKLLNQYSILVKNKEINTIWDTYASHSLENHEEAIHLLGFNHSYCQITT